MLFTKKIKNHPHGTPKSSQKLKKRGTTASRNGAEKNTKPKTLKPKPVLAWEQEARLNNKKGKNATRTHSNHNPNTIKILQAMVKHGRNKQSKHHQRVLHTIKQQKEPKGSPREPQGIQKTRTRATRTFQRTRRTSTELQKRPPDHLKVNPKWQLSLPERVPASV